MEIKVYTDGSCLKNPGGAGGWGVLIEIDGQAETFSGGDPETTSNRMELMAAIRALEILPPGMKLTLYTDSSYVQTGITEWVINWKANAWKTSGNKPVKNIDLWMRLDEANKRHKVKWNWVRSHNGNTGNEVADFLAGEAANSISQ